MRGVRLQIDYLKPELLLREHEIAQAIVVFASTRICERGAALWLFRHTDQAELLAWQERTGAKRTFLVHGEENVMNQFAAHLDDTHVEIPRPNQGFEI